MLFITDNSIPESKFSKKFVSCKCDCGNPNELSVRFNTFTRKNPTCGSCALWKWKLSNTIKYGRLSLICSINDVKSIGRQKLPWTCDCGKVISTTLSHVISGNTKSCGCLYSEAFSSRVVKKHVVKSKDTWLSEIPELIDFDLPNEWSLKARIKPKFKCVCGREFSMTFWAFKSGITKCGLCDSIEFKRGYLLNGLIYDDDSEIISLGSTLSKFFKCVNCNERSEFIIRNVANRVSNKCKNCGEHIDAQKFGKLKIKKSGYYKKYSTSEIEWICDCGNEFNAIVSNVLNGNTKSCGRCRSSVNSWFLRNVEEIRSVKCPIIPSSIPPGGVVLTELITSPSKPSKAVCPACKGEYYPRWGDIRKGVSLTCGCVSNRISCGQLEISEFIRSYGFTVENEFCVNGLKYDIFVKERNLLIEFNGLKWHSMRDSKIRDINKYRNSVGYRYSSIYEDEWANRNEPIKHYILNILNVNKPIKIRGSSINVQSVDMNVANELYEKYHYLGPCSSNMNYGVVIDNKLVACASFKRPTRQSKYEFELVRMISNPGYRIYGVWTKVIETFVRDFSPNSIVSFSDNRLFSGETYSKIGFKYDGLVKPDYYWVHNNIRKHKSGLRKKPGEVGTENEIRTSQGMNKIWDLGKKRWVWSKS